jgi:6-phosphofructokinase 2
MTVTPNPAIDIATSVSRLAPFSKLRCTPPLRDPGGGGINVARVIKRLGGDVAAVYPAGASTGQLLRGLMDREGVRSITTPTSEETREDFTVFEEATKQQYRFVLPGARLREAEWQKCLDMLASIDPPPDFVVASGSLPPGAPEDFFGKVASIAKKMNSRMIVDSSGTALKAALTEGVYLIKPNLREFRELTGTSSADDRALIDAGRSLIAQGFVKLIALSLGSEGALLIGEDHALRANGLPIKPASVVGAGDSFLGAMVWSLAQGDALDIALRYGVAAGSAALLNPGTELSHAADVQRLVQQVSAVSCQ